MNLADSKCGERRVCREDRASKLHKSSSSSLAAFRLQFVWLHGLVIPGSLIVTESQSQVTDKSFTHADSCPSHLDLTKDSTVQHHPGQGFHCIRRKMVIGSVSFSVAGQSI